MKQRDFCLDVLRVLACFMVALMHAPRPSMGLNAFVCAGDSLFTEPSIGLFFMVSGALLLPTKHSYFSFLKHRLSKVIAPTLIFTAFYVCVNLNRGRLEFVDIPHIICSVPFSPQGSQLLWFMYALIGLYLLAPIISPFLETAPKKELQFVLLLWIITLAWPILTLFVQIDTTSEGILYEFSGYIGYFVLGYYLKKYPIKTKMITNCLILLVPYFVYYFIKKYGINIDFYTLFWYQTIPGALMSFAWWQIIHQAFSNRKINGKTKDVFALISNLSFGVYLLHIYVLQYCIWPSNIFVSMQPVLYLLVSYVLTILISIIICYAISFLPFGKYIIGYQRKK